MSDYAEMYVETCHRAKIAYNVDDINTDCVASKRNKTLTKSLKLA